jgi:hypothetical protein
MAECGGLGQGQGQGQTTIVMSRRAAQRAEEAELRLRAGITEESVMRATRRTRRVYNT